MAGSRLANFGTIFSRITGLLETGAVKEVPLWYNVYKKYPPELEPCSERAMPPQDPIPEIVYEEDFLRAKMLNTSESNTKNLMTADTRISEDEKKVSKLLNSVTGQ